MELLNNFFTIKSVETAGESANYTVSLNTRHAIYKAHFPEMPVTPGVCIIQMAVELLSHQLEKKLNIQTIKNVKFLSVISPDETPEVGYSIQGVKEADGMVEAKVTVASGEKTFAKISLICKTA